MRTSPDSREQSTALHIEMKFTKIKTKKVNTGFDYTQVIGNPRKFQGNSGGSRSLIAKKPKSHEEAQRKERECMSKSNVKLDN